MHLTRYSLSRLKGLQTNQPVYLLLLINQPVSCTGSSTVIILLWTTSHYGLHINDRSFSYFAPSSGFLCIKIFVCLLISLLLLLLFLSWLFLPLNFFLTSDFSLTHILGRLVSPLDWFSGTRPGYGFSSHSFYLIQLTHFSLAASTLYSLSA